MRKHKHLSWANFVSRWRVPMKGEGERGREREKKKKKKKKKLTSADNTDYMSAQRSLSNLSTTRGHLLIITTTNELCFRTNPLETKRSGNSWNKTREKYGEIILDESTQKKTNHERRLLTILSPCCPSAGVVGDESAQGVRDRKIRVI